MSQWRSRTTEAPAANFSRASLQGAVGAGRGCLAVGAATRIGQREGAIEIAAAGEMEAAEMAAADHLGQADGIGIGNEGDVFLQPALGLGALEEAGQLMDHRHARLLIGMERRLEIGPGPPAGPAIDQHRQAPALHRREPRHILPPPFDHLALLCRLPALSGVPAHCCQARIDPAGGLPRRGRGAYL